VEEWLARMEEHIREAMKLELVSEDGSAQHQEVVATSGDAARDRSCEKCAEGEIPEGRAGDTYR
jgi:hypothetical protein